MKKKLLELEITLVDKVDSEASLEEGLYINGKLMASAGDRIEAPAVIQAVRKAAGLKIKLKSMNVRTDDFVDFPQSLKSCRKIKKDQ